MCLSPDEYKDMLKNEWERAAKKIQGYHIHIYFDQNDPTELFAAPWVASKIEQLFPEFVRGRYDVGVVGPHVAKNIEIDLKAEGFGPVLQWLQMNSLGLSILVHPETGDDLVDHLESSIWVNEKKGYNDAFFDRIRATRKPNFHS